MNLLTTLTILILSITLSACSIQSWQTSELHTVCVRYIDSEGYLRGSTALYNTRGARRVLDLLSFSHAGKCSAQAQGPTRKSTFCLVASSPCFHDRTTWIWEGQEEYYLDKYPGSYYGKCTSECSKHKDECLKRAMYPSPPEILPPWLRGVTIVEPRRIR